jgi:hypothetical protein
MQMKYLDDRALFVAQGWQVFEHVVETDAGHVPGMVACLTKLFSDADIDRGRELRLRLFRSTARADQAAGGGEPCRSSLPVVASAALFLFDQKLMVLDVIPGADSGADSTAAKAKLSTDEYRMLANAIIDLALDQRIQMVYFPTESYLAPPGSVPYDAMAQWYGARLRTTLGRRRHWLVFLVNVENDQVENDRIVRLKPTAGAIGTKPSVSLVHTFQEAAPRNPNGHGPILRRILDVAARLDVPLTLCIPGCHFHDTMSLMPAGSSHGLAFCGAGRPADLLRELSRLRTITSAVKGYRPPYKSWIPEIADRTLSFYDISWVLHRPIDGHRRVATHRHGIVRLPVTVDDATLADQGVTEWASAALATVNESPISLIELTSDSADHWLPEYHTILEELRSQRAIRLCEDVASDAWRGGAANPA